MNKSFRILTWIIQNGALAYLIHLGLNGSEGATRVVCFAVGFFAVVSLVGFDEKTRQKLKASGRSVPAWISHGAGAVIVGVLVWHGWWFSAAALTFCELMEAHIYNQDD